MNSRSKLNYNVNKCDDTIKPIIKHASWRKIIVSYKGIEQIYKDVIVCNNCHKI